MRKPKFDISKLSPVEALEFKKRLKEYNEYRGKEVISLEDCNKPNLTKEQKLELYNYNIGLGDLLDEFLDKKKGNDLIDSIKDFILSLDKEKCKRINIDNFIRGYEAITNDIGVTTEEYDNILNANLDKELRKEPYNCKEMPNTCNYKYFLKSFTGILNKETKIKLYEYLYIKISAIGKHLKVSSIVKDSEPIELAELLHVIDNKISIDTLTTDMIKSIYKTLENKEVLKSLKDKYGREIINEFKNEYYQHIYYKINRDIMHLKKSFNTLTNIGKGIYKVNCNKTYHPIDKNNIKINKQRNRQLNKDFQYLVSYNKSVQYWEKHKDTLSFPNKDKYKDKERDRLRRRLYYLTNKERIMAINKRYITKKKMENNNVEKR